MARESKTPGGAKSSSSKPKATPVQILLHLTSFLVLGYGTYFNIFKLKMPHRAPSKFDMAGALKYLTTINAVGI